MKRKSVLHHAVHEAPLHFDRRAYERFSAWLDRELGELEARWAHTAAPALPGVNAWARERMRHKGCQT